MDTRWEVECYKSALRRTNLSKNSLFINTKKPFNQAMKSYSKCESKKKHKYIKEKTGNLKELFKIV